MISKSECIELATGLTYAVEHGCLCGLDFTSDEDGDHVHADEHGLRSMLMEDIRKQATAHVDRVIRLVYGQRVVFGGFVWQGDVCKLAGLDTDTMTGRMNVLGGAATLTLVRGQHDTCWQVSVARENDNVSTRK